ncbi:MAG: hypothetical protein HDR04_14305 [Lachnospiraceae bacterium]|nr:hypothetical protein [Lachnospiraceae bacterium]
MKREFDIEGYHFKLEPTIRGGLSVNGQKAKYDINLITHEQDGSLVFGFVGTCRTISEGHTIAWHYVNDIKAGNNVVSMEKALEAYNTIRAYCKQKSGCEGCMFEMEDSTVCRCLFDYEGACVEWPDLDLN